jgi:hypothetical protein
MVETTTFHAIHDLQETIIVHAFQEKPLEFYNMTLKQHGISVECHNIHEFVKPTQPL